MKLKTKKILAKEFILIMILSCLMGVGYLLTFIYNSYLNNTINKLEIEIFCKKNLADSLSISYNKKTFEDKGDYIARVYLALKEIGYKKISNEYNLRKRILNDKILREDIYKCLKENIEGFTKSKLEFYVSLTYQLTKEDIENKNKAKMLLAKTNVLKSDKKLAIQKKLNNKEQIDFTSNLFYSLVLLVYLIRPLIYLLKWSLTTLRKTE